MRLKLEAIRFRYAEAAGTGRRAGGAARDAAPAARPWVLDGVALEVAEGEFFTLLGPSGCGKTTLLWIVAGFLRPQEGRLLFDGDPADALPPERRGVGVVFQNYALFPHLSVRDNVAFGLHGRAMSRGEVARRVGEMLDLVALGHLAARRPDELSGGQQQRVALARALAPRPRVLLMDEPLSNLDAALRVETRERFRALQRELGITTLYVTHDQEEALATSDRIAILREGRVRQVGVPEEVHDRPASASVAAFLGRCNLLGAELPTGAPDGPVRVAGLGELEGIAATRPATAGAAQAWCLALRPERLRLADPAVPLAEGEVRCRAQLAVVEFLGERRLLRCRLEGHDDFLDALIPAAGGRATPRPGETVTLAFHRGDARLVVRDDD